jgi:O-antigen/teichoic acid export membrane protein
MPLGYALGPALAATYGATWPLAGAAVLVVVAMSTPALVPEVRQLRIQRPAEATAPEPVLA